MLFVDETDPSKVYESEEWKELKQLRNLFLNKMSAQNVRQIHNFSEAERTYYCYFIVLRKCERLRKAI